MHALVVDDDDFTRVLLVRTLHGLGVESVDDARSAADGMASAAKRKPDLAILDLDLGPGPTGIDLGYGLRKANPTVAVIILSSYADPRLLGANRDLPDGGLYLSKREVGDVDVLARAIAEVTHAPHGRRAVAPSAMVGGRRLSDNQVEIMRLVAEGFSNAEIGRRRHLTDAAVEKAIARLIKQLELQPGRNDNPRVLVTQAYFALIGSTQVRRD